MQLILLHNLDPKSQNVVKSLALGRRIESFFSLFGIERSDLPVVLLLLLPLGLNRVVALKKHHVG